MDMYTKLNNIVSNLKNLGKPISNEDIIEKILRCLPHEWHPKVTVIQEAQDLLGSLMTHKLSMRRQEEIPNIKNKRVALKSSKTRKKTRHARISFTWAPRCLNQSLSWRSKDAVRCRMLGCVTQMRSIGAL